ncbi:MAG: radical SAM protein [Armatimonadota bacterium]
MQPLPTALAPPATGYPEDPAARTRWILERRGARRIVDPRVAYATLSEVEPGPDATPWTCSTLFLSNRECPFRCLMCDLWQDTLADSVQPGDIPAQIDTALAALPPARAVKLYNAGSFFDPGAIPEADYPAIAERVRGFERVIVESHTRFLGARTRRLRDLIHPARLEVAIGLETIHPVVLDRLNKRMTLDDFDRAAQWLRAEDIALRCFLLVRPPFLSEAEGVEWACRSLEHAFDQGASLCALIPVRAGNGAMEALEAAGDFTPPRVASLETALRHGLALGKGRVLGDLWDIDPARAQPGDNQRIARIREMNQTQRPIAPTDGFGPEDSR